MAMGSILQDLRHGVRILLKTPGFTLLALQIGIRMALGARPKDVLGMVVRKAMLFGGGGRRAGDDRGNGGYAIDEQFAVRCSSARSNGLRRRAGDSDRSGYAGELYPGSPSFARGSSGGTSDGVIKISCGRTSNRSSRNPRRRSCNPPSPPRVLWHGHQAE